MTLGEPIKGEAFLKVPGQDLTSRGELPAVAGQKLFGFIPGIVKTGSIEDTMPWRQGSSTAGSLPQEYKLSFRRRRSCSKQRLRPRRHCVTKLWTWPIAR